MRYGKIYRTPTWQLSRKDIFTRNNPEKKILKKRYFIGWRPQDAYKIKMATSVKKLNELLLSYVFR